MHLSKQENQVVTMMQYYDSINSQLAFKDFGITRLADRVYTLRKKGYEITTIMTTGINRHGDKVRYAEYVLDSIPPKEEREKTDE